MNSKSTSYKVDVGMALSPNEGLKPQLQQADWQGQVVGMALSPNEGLKLPSAIRIPFFSFPSEWR